MKFWEKNENCLHFCIPVNELFKSTFKSNVNRLVSLYKSLIERTVCELNKIVFFSNNNKNTKPSIVYGFPIRKLASFIIHILKQDLVGDVAIFDLKTFTFST